MYTKGNLRLTSMMTQAIVEDFYGKLDFYTHLNEMHNVIDTGTCGVVTCLCSDQLCSATPMSTL
jgi:hypothetical protein